MVIFTLNYFHYTDMDADTPEEAIKTAMKELIDTVEENGLEALELGFVSVDTLPTFNFFEIELNSDSSQVLLAKTGEPIATNIYSENPHDWEIIETAKLKTSGYYRVSDYDPHTGKAYAVKQ